MLTSSTTLAFFTMSRSTLTLAKIRAEVCGDYQRGRGRQRMKTYVTESWREAATVAEQHESMRVMRIKLPSQEVILVWVFVKYLHLQLLTRYFMDNHLTHTQTITQKNRYMDKHITATQNENTKTCKQTFYYISG